MAFFTKKLIDQLFVAESTGSDRGFVAFVTPQPITPLDGTLSIEDALTNSVYAGSLIFSAVTPTFVDATAAQDFVKKVLDLFATTSASRGVVWSSNPNAIESTNSSLMGLKADGSALNTALQAPLTSSLFFAIQNGISVSLDSETSVITLNGLQNNLTIDFSGPSAPETIKANIGTLNFKGPLRGCVQFSNSIKRLSLLGKLKWGFQYLYPDQNGEQDAKAEWLPFAQNVPAGDSLGFNISIDPSDVTNKIFNPCIDPNAAGCTIEASYNSRRTFFDFTGKNSDNKETIIFSYFTSNYGNELILTPKLTSNNVLNGRLVITIGETNGSSEQFHFSPEGDFSVTFKNSNATNEYYLMCGVSGTEFFKLSEKGDTIRFISKKPALAPKFPFETASPVKAPESPVAPLLTDGKETSWATILNTSGNIITYVSQPKGSALFGDTGATFISQDLFAFNSLGFTYSADATTLFPMAPYLGLDASNGSTTFSSDDTEKFESQVISQTRRNIIGKLSTNTSLIPATEALNDADAVSTYSTTPSGLLSKTTSSGGKLQWNEIFLGQNEDNNKDYKFEFLNPQNELVEALQTSDLFLVTANSKYLGVLGGSDPNTATFQNVMSIDSWELQANVGQTSKYNNYKNIIIIKGRTGKLYDPDAPSNDDSENKSLVANPKKWSQRDLFASPSTLNTEGELQEPDSDQLIILSQWLQSYFAQAHEQSGNPYFTKFNKIAKDPNWTGILVLAMDIKSVPSNLQGIMAGVTDPEAFNAHHFAIEINPVKKGASGAVVDQPSSMFGLIYYVDPDFNDSQKPPQTIAPTTATTYDFRLLTLKVLFENTAVKNFESYSQLTINELFDSDVISMGDPKNIFNNILLKGSFQMNDGKAVYSMGSVEDNVFLFDSNVYNKIEITDVLLTSRESPKAGYDESWFSMDGFIDYKIVQFEETVTLIDEDPTTISRGFDIFSFGSDKDKLEERKGLNFGNLGIPMIFSETEPNKDKTLSFDATEITFDLVTSTPRKSSMYVNFALDLEGLVIGTSEKDPKSLGFLTVITDARLSGVSGSNYYGLKFKLNMGTPGELAGKVSLNSFLLLSWTPESTSTNYKVNLGISLPGTGGGAKLISLQTVLKLSIGMIRLTFDYGKNSFLLMFTEIALKFLGLLKIPPSGSTLFFLFGNPSAGGKSSGLGWYAMYNKEPGSGSDSLLNRSQSIREIEKFDKKKHLI